MEETTMVVEPITELSVRSRIYSIRGVHVMLAHDLADIYQVSTSVFNQAVKRNEERFPENFRFQLTKSELEEVITNCDNPDRLRFSPALPYAFTEQGIAMLSGVLKSDVAVQVSIRLMNTFVAMRRTLASIAPLLTRIEAAERRQIMDQAKNDANQVRNEERFKLVLDAMQEKKFPPQKIFFDGQFYDAFVWLKKYIRMARKELIVIDPYFAASVLPQIAQKRDGVSVVIVQCKRGRRLLPDVDVQMFNAQYKNSLSVKESERFHDRYFIIDRKTLVHIGASLNYFGKKCFACSTFDPIDIPEMLAKLQM